MINFKIDKKNNNKKLVNVILLKYSFLSSSIIYKALRKKDILINGKRIKENISVFENDEVIAYIDIEKFTKNNKLDIVYEDDNILVINKAQGISVTENTNEEHTLTKLVQDYCTSAMPCHRLDRNTGGLVLFAKNSESLEILLQKFKNREIDKYYVCLVYGIPKVKSQRLVAYLFKDNKKSLVYISDSPKKGYQKIITSYKIVSSNKDKNISLLEIKLETGRTHQIRAHLAHIGYPIIGDGKYGINEINKKFKEKKQMLMSYKLLFNFSSDAGKLHYLQNKIIEISYDSFKKN